LLVCLILAATAACAGRSHKSPHYSYSSESLPPPDWTPEKSKEVALLFRHQDPPMGIMVNTECDRYQDAPLTSLSRSLFISFENRREISRSAGKVDGHDAEVVVMQCSLDGAPLKVKAYTFKTDQCVYDIAYMAAPDHFDEGLAIFEEYVRGFKVERK